MSTDNFRAGDFYRLDDRTGRKVRASRTRKEWTGKIVDKALFDRRHPQDFVRGLRDRQTVPDPRPDAVPVFIGPLTTTLATAVAAGGTTIPVASSVRFAGGDLVLIMLDNGDTFRVIVSSVPDAASLEIANPLPWSVAVGNVVINTTAVAPAELD